MTNQNAELINQLNMLLRLTATEATTARTRVAQATQDDTRTELLENARNSDRRQDAIRKAVTDLGGVPDALGITLAKAAHAVRVPLEQTVPLTEALLSDLALEHQLFDRARLVKVLARNTGRQSVVSLAERLEDAHGTTIQWLFTVLSETAIGGPAALAPTTMQTAATTARHAATLAASVAASGVNRAVATAGSVNERVQDTAGTTVSSQVNRVATIAGSAKRIFTVGRDATLAQTEKQARKQSRSAARSVHGLRENLGAVSGSELPIEGYDSLNTREASAALRDLNSPDQLRVVLAYEQSHKNRQALLDAANKRITEIAEQLVST